ncbi:LuxR C-terminal-related transcriptional regulator [Streptomyces sp. NPDC047061]|uniref:helix-turn-helix transcriptional regulator n=1 Tax=Streptomyces sp. NPDC047061 TaxID=3154605 RepID=UPI0033E16427
MVVEATDPISREGALSQLRRDPGVRLCTESAAGPATVTLFICDGFDSRVLTRLRRIADGGGRRVVLVADALREAEVRDAVACGVSVVVRREEATGRRLSAAVLEAARGDVGVPLGSPADRTPACPGTAHGPLEGSGSGLTTREVDVLRLIAEGLDTGEIAAALCYSERTIKKVIQGLTTRLALRTRAHAVAFALREGWL